MKGPFSCGSSGSLADTMSGHDALSKFHDGDDWMLNSKYFRILDKLWGPHTFDRFASATNKQCEKFNSRFWCPASAGVNALAYNWVGQNNWVNPPYALIGRVLLHMKCLQGSRNHYCAQMAQERVVAFAAFVQRHCLGAICDRRAVPEYQEAG